MLRILDMQGKIIYESKMENQYADNIYSVESGVSTKGMYLLQLSGKDKIVQQAFVID